MDSRLKHSTEQSGASGEACYVHFLCILICKNYNYLFDKESVLGETCFACLHLLEKVGKIHHRRQEGYIQDFELVSKENIES